MNALALSLIYGPTLTSTHDYWKNHRFDYVDFCEQSNMFLESYLGLSSNPADLQSQNRWGFSVPLPDPQVGKSFVGSSTFATVQKLLWYNCSPVCVLPTWWLCSGPNGDLLHKDLCHTSCLPGLLLSEPLSSW